MKLLVSKREANLPIFLKFACEELRFFGVYEKVGVELFPTGHSYMYKSMALSNTVGKLVYSATTSPNPISYSPVFNCFVNIFGNMQQKWPFITEDLIFTTQILNYGVGHRDLDLCLIGSKGPV